MQTKLNLGDSAKQGGTLSSAAIAVVSSAVKAYERSFGCWDPRRFADVPFSGMEHATLGLAVTHETVAAEFARS